MAADLQALQVAGIADRGIGRYAAALAAALADQDRLAVALLAPELPPPAGLPGGLSARGLCRWDGMAAMREVLAGASSPVMHLSMAPFLHVGAADPSVLTVAPHWSAAGCPRAAVLYDLIPLRAARHYLSSPGALERYQARARWVADADLVLAISEHTRSEAVELLGCRPDRVVNVGAGVSAFFCGPDGTDEHLFRLHLARWVDRPFVLCVTGSDSRKNTERLIEAIGILAADGVDVGVVVVGDLTDEWVRRLDAAAVTARVSERVEMTGPVTDELLRACYRRAQLTVMPSLAEGSGLPVLESAACGTAAVGSSTTALAEVTATALAQFDPTDPAAMASCIAAMLDDGERRASVLAAQASAAAAATWPGIAAAVADALDTVARRVPASAWAPPPSTGSFLLIGPTPPAGGGIGVYNERLLDGSDDRVQWTTANRGRPQTQRTRWIPDDVVGLQIRPAAYDAVMYTIGNSDGHLGRIALALRYPGWMWLHETRLPALATTALEHLDDEAFSVAMRRVLARAYPGRSPWGAARRAGRSNLGLVEAGVGLVPLLAERSRGFLVNSQAARNLLVMDLAPLAHHPPVHVLPPACPPVDPVGDPGRTGPGPDQLVAFGIVSMAKRPDLLVDAAARLGCRLAFVGPCPPILRQVIDDRARLRDIADQVEVTGPVDGGSWRDWLARATVAVQLRDTASGEMSAAVLEALAAGVPVATNLASAVEYPDDARWLVSLAGPDALAASLRPLLESPGAQRSLAAGGLEFAAAHQFHHLHDALLSVVLD